MIRWHIEDGQLVARDGQKYISVSMKTIDTLPIQKLELWMQMVQDHFNKLKEAP